MTVFFDFTQQNRFSRTDMGWKKKVYPWLPEIHLSFVLITERGKSIWKVGRQRDWRVAVRWRKNFTEYLAELHSCPYMVRKEKHLKSGSKRLSPFPIWGGKRKSGWGLPVSYLSFVLIAEKEKIVFRLGTNLPSAWRVLSVKRFSSFNCSLTSE